MVAGARGTLFMRRRAEILATWPPCPDCNPLDTDDGYWACRTCTGMGRVPPRTTVAVALGDGERPCAACPVGIQPNGWAVEHEGREYHPGCLARVQRAGR